MRRSPILTCAGLVALGAVASVAACDVGGPEPEELDVPGLRIESIEVTTRLADDEGFAPAGLALDGSTVSTTGTSIRVRVNRFLDPSTATRQAICVQSATTAVRSIEDCTAGLLLRPSYDPVTRVVTYFLETDTTQLAPDTFYRVTLLRSEGENGFGLRAFDGPPLGGPFALEFRTEKLDGIEPAPTEGPVLDINFCKQSTCFRVCSERPEAERAACGATCDKAKGIEEVFGSCAFGSCHQPTKDQEVPMGLDLYAAEGVAETAIARVAHGTQRGAGAQNPDEASIAFGRAMPIISPGDPGNSYLLYKVLANPAFHNGLPFLEPGETDRLRSSFVVGAPMPPTAQETDAEGNLLAAGNKQFSFEDARLLSQWIAAGADTTRCGTPPAPVP